MSIRPGKRVLITHSIIDNIMGSTVVTLDLATYLCQQGVDVTVYAAYIGDPAGKAFRDQGITVTDDDGPELHLKDFDYVWVNSQVLPLSIVDQLGRTLQAPAPIFIFHHMSTLVESADEFPYILDLEERLSSLTLFVSADTRDVMLPWFATPPPDQLYPNPAPLEFASLSFGRKAHPQRILMVSNHLPPELHVAAQLLSEAGADIHHLGEGGAAYEPVTPELLSEYDLVITIGKTVQYCLVSGLPVYVYDHFGGPGYLTAENLDETARRNYSGRGFAKQAPHFLAKDVLDGYGIAFDFQAAHRERFAAKYSIANAVSAVFEAAKPRQIDSIDARTTRVYTSAERFGARYYRLWGYHNHAEADRAADRLALDSLAHQRDELADEVEALRSSWSFRIGQTFTAPVAAALSLFRRLGRQG